MNAFDQEIINSQFFIFNRIIVAQLPPTQPVVTHEIGHALGLGHKFGCFAASPFLSSIMAYDGASVITAADKATIKNLYQATPEASEEKVPGLFGS